MYNSHFTMYLLTCARTARTLLRAAGDFFVSVLVYNVWRWVYVRHPHVVGACVSPLEPGSRVRRPSWSVCQECITCCKLHLFWGFTNWIYFVMMFLSGSLSWTTVSQQDRRIWELFLSWNILLSQFFITFPSTSVLHLGRLFLHLHLGRLLRKWFIIIGNE